VSPDGRRAAVIDQGVALLDLDASAVGERRVELIDAAWLDGDPATLVTLSSQRAASGTRCRIEDHHTGALLVEQSVRPYVTPRLAPDGRSLAFSNLGLRGALQRHPIDRAGLGVAEGLPVLGHDVLEGMDARLITLEKHAAARAKLSLWYQGAHHEIASLARSARPERARLSPDGARLALQVNGRVAIFTLPA